MMVLLEMMMKMLRRFGAAEFSAGVNEGVVDTGDTGDTGKYEDGEKKHNAFFLFFALLRTPL